MLVREAAAEAGVPVFAGAVINRALGKLGVSGAEILNPDGSLVTLPCDLIAMSGGWNPALHLTSHLDGKPVWDERIAAFVPGTLPPGMSVVGAAAGAGLNANIEPLWQAGKYPAKSFVDFQNDVTARDVTLANQEGFSAVEHAEALHHARHGDRPGQDRQRQRSGADGRGAAASISRRPAPRASARLTRRLRSARSPGRIRARISSPRALPRRMILRPRRVRYSSKPGCGCARSIFRVPARIGWPRRSAR